MNKTTIYSSIVACGLILGLIVAFIMFANYYPNYAKPNYPDPTILEHVTVTIGDEINEVSLPHSFTGLAPRTQVIVHGLISSNSGDSIYIKSVYAPLKVYIDNVLIYEYGQEGTYPNFMHDPATGVAIVGLPERNPSQETSSIRMEFSSMISRDTLTIHPPIYGRDREIFSDLAEDMLPVVIIAIFELIVGLFLIVTSMCILVFEKKGIIFMWLGIFTISVGLWGFGECNLTALFVHNSNFLYFITFIGFFTMPIPIFYFVLNLVDFRNKRPLMMLSLFMEILALTAFLAQLFHIVSFPKSMFWFHVLIPISLCIFALLVVFEAFRYRNKGAMLFVIPSIMIALCSMLELLNYNILFTWLFTSIFQIGILFFIFYTAISGGLYIKDFMRIKQENDKLSFETRILEQQIYAQKKHHDVLIETEQQIREQRHDLKHHFIIINKMIEDNQKQELQKYINHLSSEIPVETEIDYCENSAVNAIISHYSNVARSKDIEISIKLSIPENNEHITDQNLCIIVGNIFENAIEACDRIENGHKFISLSSYTQQNLLTIVMDNSFNGKYAKKVNIFLSQKRNSAGTGTRSVSSVAQKNGGDAIFEICGLIFKSSIYVKL